MSLGWGNMNDGNQGFLYQSFLLFGAKPNDIGMENDDDENVGGDDTNMHSQPNYPNFSSYFMTNGDMEALCFVIV